MKIVRKTLLATAITAALTPAAAMADTTLFGNFDINAAVESGTESALAVNDSPFGDNVIGIEGDIELENGNAITYQYVVNIDLDGDGQTNSSNFNVNVGGTPVAGTINTTANNAFTANYHSYVGYKTDSFEVRAGNQYLPLRLVLDKADNFAGTHADANNVIMSNTTAPSSIMLLGGTDAIKYAVSIDTNNTTGGTPAATGENAGDPNANDGIRYGGMVDFSVTEEISVAAGFESLTDTYDAYGLSVNAGVAENLDLSLAFNQRSPDGNNVAEPSAILVGAAFGLNDSTTLKAQVGIQDADNAAVNDDATYYAIGADFELAENVTTYVLYAGATDFTNAAGFGTQVLGTVEKDGAGDGDVLAAGVKLSF